MPLIPLSANGGTLPPAFASLLSFLSPSQLQSAFTQLSGEAGTGAAQAGTQAMNSFLSLVTNPFAENRPFAPNRPVSPMYVKAVPRAAAWNPDPRRWGIWAAAYGGQTNAAGDALGVGSHDRSVSDVGFATGLDYRVTPYTVAGFALAGGGYPLWLVGRSRQRTQRHVPGGPLQLDACRCGLCLGRNRLRLSSV